MLDVFANGLDGLGSELVVVVGELSMVHLGIGSTRYLVKRQRLVVMASVVAKTLFILTWNNTTEGKSQREQSNTNNVNRSSEHFTLSTKTVSK